MQELACIASSRRRRASDLMIDSWGCSVGGRAAVSAGGGRWRGLVLLQRGAAADGWAWLSMAAPCPAPAWAAATPRMHACMA